MQVPRSTRKETVYRNPSAFKPYKGNPALDFEFQVKQCSRQRLDGWIWKEPFKNFHLVCPHVFFYSGVFSSFHAYSLIALVFVPWSKLPIIYKRRLVLPCHSTTSTSQQSFNNPSTYPLLVSKIS